MGVASSGLISGLLAVSAAHVPAGAPSVEVNHARVVFGDIVDVSSLPASLRTRAAALPITRFHEGQSAMTLSTRRLAERARALMPVLAAWFPDEPDIKILLRLKAQVPPSPLAARTPQGCARVTHGLGAGDIPTTRDLAPSDCKETASPSPFDYDRRSGVVRAWRAVAPGETIAAVPSFALAGVSPGQRLYVKTHVGPVVIEREVRAAQPARAGQALFVETSDGVVFSATAPEAGQ